MYTRYYGYTVKLVLPFRYHGTNCFSIDLNANIWRDKYIFYPNLACISHTVIENNVRLSI